MVPFGASGRWRMRSTLASSAISVVMQRRKRHSAPTHADQRDRTALDVVRRKTRRARNPSRRPRAPSSQASEIARSSASVLVETPAGRTSSDMPSRSPRLSACRRSDRALPFSEKSRAAARTHTRRACTRAGRRRDTPAASAAALDRTRLARLARARARGNATPARAIRTAVPTGSNSEIHDRPRRPNMMKALPESENRKCLSPMSATQASAEGWRRRISAARSSSAGVGLAQRRGGRPQQLTQREHGCQQRDAHQRAQRSRRMAIELELPPQLLRVVDVAVDEESQAREPRGSRPPPTAASRR